MTQHALLTDTSFSSVHKLLHTELPGADEYHAAWPGELAGCDSAGRLVWVERLHNVDIHALAKLSDDELSLHRAQSMEFLSFAKREAAESVGAAAREYHKHIFVIDLHGFNVGHLLSGDARRVISVVNSVCCSRLLSLFFLKCVVRLMLHRCAPGTIRRHWRGVTSSTCIRQRASHGKR